MAIQLNFNNVKVPASPTKRDQMLLAKEVAAIVILLKHWRIAVDSKSKVLAQAAINACFMQMVADLWPKYFSTWTVTELMEMYDMYYAEMDARASQFTWWE